MVAEMVMEPCPCTAPIQIEVTQLRVACVACKEVQLEAVYWKQTNTGWRTLKICVYCRDLSLKAQRENLLKIAQIRWSELHSDPVTAKVPRAFMDDGEMRCSVCRSTCYKEVTIIKARDLPAMYIEEVLCWAGHILREQWKQGSPVRGRFPISEHVKTPVRAVETGAVVRAPETRRVLAASMPKRLPPTINLARRGVPVSMRRVMRVEEEEVSGCDARCIPFKFIDPNDVDGPVYLMTRHSAEAHNEHNAVEDGEQPMTYSWPGLTIDFAAFDIKVEGRPIRKDPTPQEWKLLRSLAQTNGTVATQAKLLRECWGREFEDEAHLLRVNMARLRAKLQPYQGYIQTKPGVGYMMARALGQNGMVSP